MFRICYCLIFIICYVFTNGQIYFPDNSIVKGNVTSVTVEVKFWTEINGKFRWELNKDYTKEYTYQNHLLQRIYSYNNEGLKNLDKFFVYDMDNNLVREDSYDGDILTSTINYFYKNKYIYKAQRSSTKSYNAFEVAYQKKDYNNVQQISETSYLREEDKEKNSLKVVTIHDKKIINEEVKYYDKNGNIIKKINDGSTTIYYYKNDKLVRSLLDNGEQKIESHYDDLTNVIEMKTTEISTGDVEVATFKYVIDQHSNWIKKTVLIDMKNEILYIRSIKY